MSLLVMLSVLGAVNGVALTGARVHVAMGRDHKLFSALGRWHPEKHSPFWALLAQAAIALLMIVAVGTAWGRGNIDTIMVGLGFSVTGLPWAEYHGGFDTLVAGTAPVFWIFFFLTGVAMLVLRVKDRNVPRPFVTPFYPILPLIFCGTCLYMLWQSVAYAKGLSMFGFAPLALGVPLYFISRHMRAANGGDK